MMRRTMFVRPTAMIGPAEIEDMRLDLEEAQAQLKASEALRVAQMREGNVPKPGTPDVSNLVRHPTLQSFRPGMLRGWISFYA